jgi:hypothetical protein
VCGFSLVRIKPSPLQKVKYWEVNQAVLSCHCDSKPMLNSRPPLLTIILCEIWKTNIFNIIYKKHGKESFSDKLLIFFALPVIGS